MTAATVEGETLTVPVARLDCAVCAESLAARLRETPGVREATVNFGAGKARVALDPAVLDRAGVAARIETLGYRVPAAAPGAALRFRVSGMDFADSKIGSAAARRRCTIAAYTSDLIRSIVVRATMMASCAVASKAKEQSSS